MDPINFWKLCTEYSIVQAALLTCGLMPDEHQYSVERKANPPPGYTAVRTALYNAIRTGRLDANTRMALDDYGETTVAIDVYETLINVHDLHRFLKSSGFEAPFFDRAPTLYDDDPEPGPAYPLKLAAALKAWNAVANDPERLRGKSPKQAIDAWLTEHAAELGLLNRSGAVNRTGIEEICKVVNWKPSGGATPTPVARPASTVRTPICLPEPQPKAVSGKADFNIDDDIPF